MQCENHPEVKAIGRCSDCMGAFCANCLTLKPGERYCSSCSPLILQDDNITYKEARDALKIAIIGTIFIGLILEPIAIAKALKARKKINANPRLSGLGKANVAMAISIVYLLLFTVLIVAISL